MTFFKNQRKRRKVLIAAAGIGVLTAVCGIFVFFHQKEKKGETQPEDTIILTGQENAETQKTEPVSSVESLQEDTRVEPEIKTAEDDWRIHGFPYIKLTSNLKVGDYVDVRISFADGGDFVLLSKKQIQGFSPLREGENKALWLIVSEEEILRLSSAAVDVYCNEGSSIYAIQYISDTQKEAMVNYVVSDTIKQLMEEDPNIIKRAENVKEYSLWKEYETGICRGDADSKQDEIIDTY